VAVLELASFGAVGEGDQALLHALMPFVAVSLDRLVGRRNIHQDSPSFPMPTPQVPAN